MRILVLDDDVRRHSGFARALIPHRVWHVYDYHRACSVLQREERFDVVYLDHDINDFGKRSMGPGMYGSSRELTGLDVAAFIAGLPEEKRPKQVITHTWNPDGGKAILKALEGICPVTYEPWQAPLCGDCGRSLADHTGDNRAHMVCPKPGDEK